MADHRMTKPFPEHMIGIFGGVPLRESGLDWA